MLIWLPDLSQAALNALANVVHRRLAAEGALYLAASPFAVSSSEIPNPALEAIRAIEMRRAEAETRFGTSSPRVLGEALMRAQAQPLCRPREAPRGLTALVAREVLRRWRGRLSAPDRRRLAA